MTECKRLAMSNPAVAQPASAMQSVLPALMGAGNSREDAGIHRGIGAGIPASPIAGLQ